MITKEKIEKVEIEIKRLASSFEDFKTAISMGKTWNGWSTPKESGMVMRASMDLTRSLADLRRSK